MHYVGRMRERARKRDEEEEEKKKKKKKRGNNEIRYIWGGGDGVRKKETIFPVLKVPRQCPLVLLVEAAHMIGIRIFYNIMPEGLHYGEISTNIVRATLGRNVDVTSGTAACEARSATWNSGYQLSICSRIEENHGKP
jgi:hypothetical protein